jgi:hypothetical protein
LKNTFGFEPPFLVISSYLEFCLLEGKQKASLGELIYSYISHIYHAFRISFHPYFIYS